MAKNWPSLINVVPIDANELDNFSPSLKLSNDLSFLVKERESNLNITLINKGGLLNFGRAHHRVIYFVGKKDKITIKELLRVLKITKQSLSRVLNQLVKEGFILVSTGLDKRTKNLSLTTSGLNLENELSKNKIKKIKKVINNFNKEDIDGFKKILYEMIEIDNKKNFQNLNE